VAEQYEFDIGRFKRDHPDVVLQAGFAGFGYQARKRNDWGHGVGKPVSALTLDELHTKLEGSDDP
jgi:hypothetical protein